MRVSFQFFQQETVVTYYCRHCWKDPVTYCWRRWNALVIYLWKPTCFARVICY